MDTELERILADDYLADLPERSLPELRTLRGECQEIETELSYLRRLVQGRIDIVGGELHRRRSGGDPNDLSDLIDRLPEILSDRTRSAGTGHLPQVMAPGKVTGELVEEIAEINVEAHLTELTSVPDDELAATLRRLDAVEARVSGLRKELFGRIDAIQSELARRYQTGEATVDALLSGD